MAVAAPIKRNFFPTNVKITRDQAISIGLATAAALLLLMVVIELLGKYGISL